MTLGRGLFLITVGLILALGVQDRAGTFDFSAIGWILTGVGLLVFALSFVVGPARHDVEADTLNEHRDLDEP